MYNLMTIEEIIEANNQGIEFIVEDGILKEAK